MSQKILVIQTAFLGDALLAIPLIRNIKRLYPQSEIQVLCRKGFGSFFETLGLVSKAWEVEKRKRESRQQVLAELKNIEFDIIFSPHESFRTATWVLQLKAKQKIGFKKWWNGFVFSKTVLKKRSLPDALRQISLLTAVSDDINDKIKRYSSGVPDWADMTLESELSRIHHPLKWEFKTPVVFLAPGSVWATKRWTADGFKAVALEFAKSHTIVFVGTPDERELCSSLSQQVPGSINLAGETNLLDLVFLFRKGRLLICNDSGAMHVASVAGLPTTAIFGPTVLSLGYQPWQKNAAVVEKKMSCRPCGKHGHNTCPIGTHACMKEISPQEVIQKGTSLLSGRFQ